MLTDCVLNTLGDYFVTHKFIDKGWTFEQFVEAWQSGYIVMAKG